MNLLNKEEKERLLKKISFGDGCWEWLGCIGKNGYGYVRIDSKLRLTHRVVYELYEGDIPVWLELDHLCRNRKCCNPNHLEPVTRKENCVRSPIIGKHGNHVRGKEHYFGMKTHCKRGHEFTPDNIYPRDGRRECIICAKLRAKLWRKSKSVIMKVEKFE